MAKKCIKLFNCNYYEKKHGCMMEAFRVVIVSKGGDMSRKLFVIIGNKMDLKSRVPLSEIEKFCDDSAQKPLMFLTSCKSGENVEDAFHDIAEECIRRGLGRDANNVRKSTLDIRSEPDPNQKVTLNSSSGGCGC